MRNGHQQKGCQHPDTMMSARLNGADINCKVLPTWTGLVQEVWWNVLAEGGSWSWLGQGSASEPHSWSLGGSKGLSAQG